MENAASSLRIGLAATLAQVDPRRINDLSTETVARQVFETPYEAIDSQGTTRALLFEGPLAAATHEGRTGYLGRLRAGVRYSDGSELSLREAAECLNRGLREVGNYTVTIAGDRLFLEVDRSRAWLELALTNLRCAIFKDVGSRVLGTGPFFEVENRDGRYLRLDRNPHSRHGGKLESVECFYFPTDANGRPQALLDALRAGSIDLTMDLSRSDPAQLQGFRQTLGTGYSTAMLFFNSERPPFDDLAVRRAFAQAIDRMEFTRLFYQRALAFVATSLLPPALGRYSDGLTFSPELARRALAARPISVRRLRLLLVWGPRPYLPEPLRAAEWLREKLGALGFEIELIQPKTPAEFSRVVSSAEYEMVLSGWQLETVDPGEFLDVTLSRSMIVERGKERGNRTHNLGRLDSPEMEAALQTYQRERTPAALDAAVRLVGSLVPVMPLMYGSTLLVHTAGVRGYRLSQEGYPLFADVELKR